MTAASQYRNNFNSRGFTLVETLVSMFIFSLLTGVIVTAMVNSMNTLRLLEEKIVASYLTQEAIEYVKNIRDAETLSPTGTWYGASLTPCLDLDPNDNNDVRCIIDTTKSVTSGAITACSSSGCIPMRYNSTTGVYAYSGDPSLYTRSVKLIHPDPVSGGNPNGTGDDEVLVQVEVRWLSGNQQRSTVLYHSIFNWQQ